MENAHSAWLKAVWPKTKSWAKGFPTLPHFVPPQAMPIFPEEDSLPSAPGVMDLLWNNKPRGVHRAQRLSPLRLMWKKLTLSWLNPEQEKQWCRVDYTDCPEQWNDGKNLIKKSKLNKNKGRNVILKVCGKKRCQKVLYEQQWQSCYPGQTLLLKSTQGHEHWKQFHANVRKDWRWRPLFGCQLRHRPVGQLCKTITWTKPLLIESMCLNMAIGHYNI